MGADHTRAMTISALQRRPGVSAPPYGPAGRAGRSAAVATMLGSGLSNQLGAALGALAFPVLGPAGVVAVRQWVAGVALLAIGRPRLRSFTWRQWRPVLALALVFATMNLSLYTAIDRIGLGLAATLEFLGPLSSWPARSPPPTTWASPSACWPPSAGPATSCSTG